MRPFSGRALVCRGQDSGFHPQHHKPKEVRSRQVRGPGLWSPEGSSLEALGLQSLSSSLSSSPGSILPGLDRQGRVILVPESMGYLCLLCTAFAERASTHSSQPCTRVTGRSGLAREPQGKTGRYLAWGRRTIAVSPSEGHLPPERVSPRAVRSRAQTFPGTEQKYCHKIPFSDAEQRPWESHFTVWGG